MFFHTKKKDSVDIKGLRTCVYYSNWSVYERKHFAIDVPADLITNLFYAFLAINQDTGALKLSDEWCDAQLPLKSPRNSDKKITGSLKQIFELKQLNRHMKVSASIGGWGSAEAFKNVTTSSHKRLKFIQSLIWHLKEYGFDGLDIDWEYPNNSQENELLVKLLHELRSEMDKISTDLLLTIASPAGKEQLNILDLKELDRYLSFWNVMCYDFNGESWSDKTAYHSNLFGFNGDNNLNCSDTINHYIKKGIKPEKLILGMPLYGRVFHGVNAPRIGQSFNVNSHPKNRIKGDTIDYKLIPPKGFRESFDSHKVSAFCYDDSTKQFICYDNEKSARIKAQFVILKDLGGGMWWDSCGDSKELSKSLINLFVYQIGGLDVLDKTNNHLNLYKGSTFLKDYFHDKSLLQD
ncbi:uncharacterized protein PRCAT00001006001 [Priceomyces carsonii]|uniref:uncharacterized protein n=1 Tax=Priceomyces carsonii TaxID=28549 RepID=UPI002ED87D9E|nr:unnamed protein product [Priceomyces carsonii]